jgi:hypothetical protein
MLGELTLSNELAADEQIRPWLIELLRPLSLYPDFLGRITRSARDAAARAFHPVLKLGHIHLRIFVTRDPVSTGQTWGFFRVEKIENASAAGDAASHSVEIYLYVEGLETTDRSR